MKKIYIYLLLLGAFCLSACSTNVGVESSKHPIATYRSTSGNFVGFIDGDMSTVFNATNKALDTLGYTRTAQKIRGDISTVIARAILDSKIRVDIKVINANVLEVKVNFDGGNLMKSQEIFNTINRFTRSATR